MIDPAAGWDYLSQGGAVVVPLVGAAFALYYALGLRAQRLGLGRRPGPRQLLARLQAGEPARSLADRAAQAAWQASLVPDALARRRVRVEAAVAPYLEALGAGAALASTIVTVAPLLGLLGTVSGMIEMFSSLGDGALHTQDGGIAGGIAEALLTTQLGLAIAIPGYFASRLLQRREDRIKDELVQLEGALLEQGAPTGGVA